jgi:molybdopterin-guanine dinucleotide biosynthesis protein A
MPPHTAATTTLAILAGGAGARMGKPKSLLTVNGQPILEYLLSHIDWPGPTLLVTTPGREHPPGHDLFTREVADPVADLGPLRGLLTALEACSTPLLVVTTVDMPCITAAHLNHLIDSINSCPECLGLIMHRRTDTEMRVEPFPSIFRLAARDSVAAQLSAERRSVHALTQESGFATIPAPSHWPAQTWTNLNCPADFERFLHDAD